MPIALIGLVIQVAGMAVGAAMAQMDKDKAMALLKSSFDEFGKINVPKLQKLALQQMPDTQLRGIKEDPTYRAQLNAADAQLNDVIDSGGLTLADRAALNSIRNKVSQSESAGRQAIENQMAARGTLDSGAQLALQLTNQQNSAQNLAEAGEKTAGDAQARLYQAIQQRAQNATTGLERDYQHQANAASAQDAINRGNAEIANTAARYNAGLAQQDFQNQLALAQAKAQAKAGYAGATAAGAANTQAMGAGVGQVAGNAATTLGNWATSQPASTTARAVPTTYNDYVGRGSPSDLTGGHTDALEGVPTKVLLGYDDAGNPIYGARRA